MENIAESNKISSKFKEEKSGIIKKYPFNGRCKYLIDKFYILGYEPNQLYKLLIINKENKKALVNIAKKVKTEESLNFGINSKSKNIKKKISINEFPSLLNEISNDYKKKLPDIDLITNMLFPNKINIYIKAYYNKYLSLERNSTQENIIFKKSKLSPLNLDGEENLNNRYGRDSVKFTFSFKENEEEEDDLELLDNKQFNLIFSYNPQEGSNSKKSINGFAYIFYKKYKKKHIIDDVEFTFYIPMTFCIISEYPYFNSYYKLCKQLVKLFRLKKIEIPIEIILYNIINFTLSPINGDIYLNIEPLSFPSRKTIVDSTIKSKKKREFTIIKEVDENEKEDADFLTLVKEEYSPNHLNTNFEEPNLFELRQCNEDNNISNNSPLMNRAKTILIKPTKTEKKKKKSNLKNKANKTDINKLEKLISMSPDLSSKKRNIKFENKNLVNSRFAIGINNEMKNGALDDDINLINKDLSEKHRLSKFEDIKFQSLSGYPLIQYNLSKVLLYTISPQDVLIIFFYSFLEKDILFFSKNIEFLSLTINSYLNLNFPLNDEKYYFFNACVSYENFINDNSPFVGATFTSILGINNSYNADYLNYLKKTKLKDHLAVDLDNGVIYQVDDPNDKDKNNRNKSIFEYIKKICKKEIKDDKGVIFAREIKILYEKLDLYKNESPNAFNSTKLLINISKSNFIDYDEKSIKNNNRNIQEGFYRLINYICLYFYQSLSLKSDDDKEDLNRIIINRKNKELNPETMNIIFHKDYNVEDNNYTKEEIFLLDELMETMKFESFVYGFIQSYNPIDLYKIPLTLTEEFISILSRKNFVKSQNINYFGLIDNLYKKNGVEKTYIDFNPFSSEYFKKLKNYFEREIYDENNCYELKRKIKENYLNALSSENAEGKEIDNLKYDEYILNNNLLIKYIRFLKNLPKEDYYHMFHLASTLEQNKIKNITITDIENEIEKYTNKLGISSKRDICCSNIILLFILSIKSIKNYIDCQSFLSALFQNFNVFRKYYTIIMNLVYRLMNECLAKNDYINAQNYFFFYYSCINSLRNLKLVPNENLMNIILKFDKIDLNTLLEKASECKTSAEDQNKLNENNNIEKEKNLFDDKYLKKSNHTQFVYVIYNFIKNSFIKEKDIIEKVNELKGQKTLKLNVTNKDGQEKIIEPKIKFNNGNFQYECLISTQDKILEDLTKQYEIYITDLNEDKLDNKILFEACLNIILFTRNSNIFQDIYDIFDTLKIIFNINLKKFYSMEKQKSIISINNDENNKDESI